MAGKKCPQCAETVKAEAKICRFCGHAFPDAAARVDGKQRIGAGKIIGFGFLALVGLSVVNTLMHDNTATATAPPPAPVASPSASAMDPNAISPTLVGMSLKSAARDPDSLVVERALQNARQTYVCVSYRAKNGFGGMNRDHAVFTRIGGDTSARAWNKKCTSGDLTDVTSMVSSGTHFGT